MHVDNAGIVTSIASSAGPEAEKARLKYQVSHGDSEAASLLANQFNEPKYVRLLAEQKNADAALSLRKTMASKT